MILSLMYVSATIVVAVSAIALVALYKIDKNAGRDDKANQ
jgi:hypothetical protein